MRSILCVLIVSFFSQEMDFSAERLRMVEDQIKARDITDAATLTAMGQVQRHHFVPHKLRRSAYRDYPLPIGYNQTISQPYIVAFMTAAIAPHKDMKVLEVGTGSGYQAAVLAEIVDKVYTVEIVPELASRANHILDSLDYNNVYVKSGDGYIGWEEHAPYDAIIVTAALDHIPQPLIDQLKDNACLIMPVGARGRIQSLKYLKKKGNKIKEKELMLVRFVPFTGKKGKD